MKKTFLIIALVVTGFSAFSQLKPKTEDWFFYDLTHLRYLHAPGGMEQEWFSNGHNFTFMGEWMFSDNFGLGLGLGFSSQNFHNNMRITTVEQTGEEVYSLISDTAFSNIEQTMQYVYLPLELRFRTTPNAEGDFFRVYVGAKVGVLVNAYSEFESDRMRVKYFGLDHLARFRADGYLRIGYGYFSLFASYGITELYQDGRAFNSTISEFESSKLDAIRPLAIGLSVNL